MSYIDREDAIKALRQALYEYEDKMEKRFLNSDELDIYDWSEHEIFVQNMNDIDCKRILEMPDADVEPIRHGEWIDKGDANYYCSECDGAVRHNYPNCPFCRAKMDKRES